MLHHPLQLHDICNLNRRITVTKATVCSLSLRMIWEVVFRCQPPSKATPLPIYLHILCPWCDNRPFQMLSWLSLKFCLSWEPTAHVLCLLQHICRRLLAVYDLPSWGRCELALSLLLEENAPYSLEDVVQAVRESHDREFIKRVLTKECPICLSIFPHSKVGFSQSASSKHPTSSINAWNLLSIWTKNNFGK